MDRPVIPETISGLAALAQRSRALLCDVWGVIHNGVVSFAPAVEALVRFRDQGGIVILLTNAPRPSWSVADQLDRLGVDRRSYDRIVTSGDVARELLKAYRDTKVFHLGPERDLSLYDGLGLDLAGAAEARLISCTGLFDDETETAEDYDPMLKAFAARKLEMVCANPDIVVDRGGKLIPCAGAIAVRYRAHGGEPVVVGKPHRAIYDLAFKAIDEIDGRPVPRDAITAVGDGAATDIRGANDAGVRAVFVSDGVHAAEYATDPERIAGFLRRSQARADMIMTRLIW